MRFEASRRKNDTPVEFGTTVPCSCRCLHNLTQGEVRCCFTLNGIDAVSNLRTYVKAECLVALKKRKGMCKTMIRSQHKLMIVDLTHGGGEVSWVLVEYIRQAPACGQTLCCQG